MSQSPTYELYTYFRSSCSARVRIAAHLKSIPLQYKYIHLLKSEQCSPEYRTVNPCESVPTLVIHQPDGSHSSIRQSVAALEYLDEEYPEPALMPPKDDPLARARVRELVNIIACDVQPVTNLRILSRVRKMSPDNPSAGPDWQKHFMTVGLQAYEEILASTPAGKYSVDDNVTMADLCLSPAVDGALRFGVELDKLPNVHRVYQALQQLGAFQKGGWRTQEDTPEEFRPPSTKV